MKARFQTVRIMLISLLGFVMIAASAFSATLVQTGFEATGDEAAYAAGTSISNYSAAGWQLDAGTASISSAQAAQGSQSLALDPGAEVDRALGQSASDSTLNGIVWVQGWFRGEGSAVDSPTYPADPPASSIVHFSKNRGILLYDGRDTDGNSDPWVQAFDHKGPLVATKWYQVSLMQDYQNKIWYCYVDGVLQNVTLQGEKRVPFPLGFRDPSSISKLSGFKNLSDTVSYFDGLNITSAIRGDANGDSVVDAADVVRALALANTATPAIEQIFGKNADVVNVSGQSVPDGQITQQDYEAIANLVLTR